MGTQGLYINEEGSYVIKFILQSPDGDSLAWVLSNRFSVEVGKPHSLGLVKYPGGATAGELLYPQPQVAVLDKGGNIVTSYTGGRVHATAYKARDLSKQDHLRPLNKSSVGIVNGTATFISLYIDQHGDSFQLNFTSTVVRTSSCCSNRQGLA